MLGLLVLGYLATYRALWLQGYKATKPTYLIALGPYIRVNHNDKATKLSATKLTPIDGNMYMVM